VNGSIALGAGAHVSGSALSVNGELALGDGAEISGSLSNVNGKITLTAARVGGGILLQKPSSELLSIVRDVPRIVMGPGATVHGAPEFGILRVNKRQDEV
jgi:hypothetical protein